MLLIPKLPHLLVQTCKQGYKSKDVEKYYFKVLLKFKKLLVKNCYLKLFGFPPIVSSRLDCMHTFLTLANCHEIFNLHCIPLSRKQATEMLSKSLFVVMNSNTTLSKAMDLCSVCGMGTCAHPGSA